LSIDSEIFSPVYLRKFLEKYQSSPRFIERKNVITELVINYAKKHCYILDLGCGPGIFSFDFAELGYTVIGVDGSDVMITYCNDKLKEKNLTNLSFKKFRIPEDFNKVTFDKQDIILSSSVLEYVPSLTSVLEWINHTLKQDGFFIVSIPNKNSLFRKFEKLTYSLIRLPRYYKYVYNILSLESFSNLMLGYGFEIVDKKYFSKKILFGEKLNKILPPSVINDFFVGVFKKIK
jgi:2-polyprenyl-3-methyl-5-hydroxy-6-metoxy-1,4-benzoquinol methylase